VTFVSGRVFALGHCSKGNLSPELLAKILEHLRVDDALVDKMLAQSLDDFHLLFRGEAGDGGFDDAANGGLVDGDETRTVSFEHNPCTGLVSYLW
jgi:hypothetical protein